MSYQNLGGNSPRHQFYNNDMNTSSFLSIPDAGDKYGGQAGQYGSGYSAGSYAAKATPWFKKKAFLWTAGIITVLAIAGAAVGVVLARKSSSSSTSSSTSKDSSSSGTDSSDSSFTKNSDLKLSFPGMCYSPPYSSFYPGCGDTIEGVVEDIQLMSQLTKVLRLYGADCNTSALVLDAIQRTGVDMKVFIAIYMDEDTTVYDRQLATTLDTLQTFGSDNILGVITGNEYILDVYTANGTTGQATAQALVISNMADVRKKVNALGLSSTIPVGFADAGSMITKELAEGADFVMANVHAFFSGVGIDLAAGWTWNYLETDTPSSALEASNNPPLYASEVGWPAGAFSNGSLTLNGSDASVANAQTFMNNYICQANTNGTQYFWFEAFDEAWKAAAYGGAESFWGLLDADRNYKTDLTMPDCEPATFD